MKKNILFLVFHFLLFQSCGQNSESIKAELNNKTNIPSTRIYLDIPQGFHISERIVGIEKNENVVISITDLIGGNFYKNAADVNKENFENMGITVKNYEELEIEGFTAKKIHYKNDEQEGVFLVFGDSTFSTTVTGMVYSNDSKSLKQVEKCINNISYDKSLKINPLEFAKFELSTENSAFKFSSSSAGMYTYTLNGKEIESWEIESFLMVSQLPYDEREFTVEKMTDMIFTSQMNNGFEYKEILHEEIIQIEDKRAHELIVKGVLNNMDVQMYSLIVSKGSNAFSCIGIAKENHEMNINEFKTLARTFQFRY